MAMDIIEKDKKFIRWIGMPSDTMPNSDTVKSEKPDLEPLRRKQAEFLAVIEREKLDIHEKMLKVSQPRVFVCWLCLNPFG